MANIDPNKLRPYVNKAKRAKVKPGKRVRRQRILLQRVARMRALVDWCSKYDPRNTLTWAQLQHPQMRAKLEGVIR